MDLSQSALISQFEDDSSLPEQQIDDVMPFEMDPQNESKDNANNCKSVLKLIDEVENVEEPKKGMTFSSIDELNLYYRRYAKKEGFWVVQKKKRIDEDGYAHYLSLGCARQGSRKSNSNNSFCKPSQTIRTGCKASFNAKLIDTKWYVTSVCTDHNHGLSPGKARSFRCSGNETVAALESEDNADNCKSVLKLIDEVENVEEPKKGMTFSSIDELNLYYRSYAKKEGFWVVQKKKRIDEDGYAHYLSLGCARQGSRKSNSNNSFCKPSQTIRTGCKASFNAKLIDTKWYVTSVCTDHNHGLSPGEARSFHCCKNLDSIAKRKPEINDKAGGYENLALGEKDCRNFIAKSRHLHLGIGGVEALRDYFSRMQELNDGFYFEMDSDNECRLKNVFWTDARSRALYEDFWDVVTFDTTYLTNKYKMPFVFFVGVNHHGQSILFGAALISSKDTKTFVWLFETWLKCMNGRSPNAIITDQDRAMKSAINMVFPNARHRFCLWNILKKLPEKFGSHSQYHAIKSALRSCVYDSRTCDEFDASWQSLLKCYNLENNAWLCGLYSERTFWVPAYLKDVFWANMTTTQQSESMNTFFDGYVHSLTTLKEFVDQYDNALRKMIENENVADFNSFNDTIPCVSRFYFEKQFQQLYTSTKFKEVQEEIREVLYCSGSLLKSEGGISTYQVTERVEINDAYTKKVCFNVYYNEPSCEVSCSCCWFQSRGILCRHAISVLTTLDVTVLPEKYFLNRWRKDLKRKYKFIKSSHDPLSGNPSAERYFDLCKDMFVLASIGATTVDNYMIVKNHVYMLTKKLSGPSSEQIPPSQSIPSASTIDNVDSRKLG
ncbi:protein FAR1-RELATED SEQUENCE 5-like isoform X2 [Corylus avellana]|uniref:protein FAR1-RELATED SEQUENCE 5-like isoform X2 n=1 Tax=Corylus avellana TaxID=13451 RepID=UPI00286D08FF|nr:protein FAR1-RELATED SEQUENCE 5-like isoform X2 [Corylus avellana]